MHLIAARLGIYSPEPEAAVIAHVQGAVSAWLKEFEECADSEELLAICAQKTGTRFEVIDSLNYLDSRVREYAGRGEKQFALLEREFEKGILGVTFRLLNPKPWEAPYVSVVDARGERRRRAFFTKWHEIGHLLILGGDSRESFCRTHDPVETRAPEEVLVDRIAGACAFHPDLVRTLARGPLTFELLSAVRHRLAPSASDQSSRIGIVGSWPDPALFLECRFSASHRNGHEQALRVTRVLVNAAARRSGLMIHPNSRVPQKSVIYRTFRSRSDTRSAPCDEDFSWWSASLPSVRVRVSARRVGDVVDAIIATVNSEQSFFNSGRPRP